MCDGCNMLSVTLFTFFCHSAAVIGSNFWYVLYLSWFPMVPRCVAPSDGFSTCPRGLGVQQSPSCPISSADIQTTASTSPKIFPRCFYLISRVCYPPEFNKYATFSSSSLVFLFSLTSESCRCFILNPYCCWKSACFYLTFLRLDFTSAACCLRAKVVI